MTVIFAIGLRPCSGAVLVLVFARFAGLQWAGVASVLAISLGTALTVSVLALIAVQLRSFAMQLGSGSGVSLGILSGGLTILAGAIFTLFGYGLLLASFAPTTRSMGL